MLLTKLHKPSDNNKLIERKELYPLLNNGLENKLILVSAPAGFGKTTLVSSWINQNILPVAWFSVDTGDNDPIDFISYIISSLQTVDKEFGQNLINIVQSGTPPTPTSLINLLINEMLKINTKCLLVLDDYHTISNEEINKMVDYLLEYLPENICILIISRSDPNLSLAKLRSRQQLHEIRANELSFSVPDVNSLFNKQLKMGLSNEEVNILKEKTEGWIAGLQLVALSIKTRQEASDFIKSFKGDNRFIMDYLIEEVINNQNNKFKDFLLKTSILKQFSSELCNKILGISNSQSIIENLESNNMFIVALDDERKWYRYHHLFADLLKQKLHQRSNEEIISIHRKAKLWFEQNMMVEFAIDHAFKTNDYKEAIRLIAKIVEQLWEHGQHSLIKQYGELIPAEIIKENPEFSLYYSWVLIASGNIKEATLFLSSSEDKFIQNTSNPNDEQKELIGKTYVALAYLYSEIEDSEKIFLYCKKAKIYLHETKSLWYSSIWNSLGIASHINGNFQKSTEAFNVALKHAKKSGRPYLITSIFYRTLEYEELQGHYTQAYKKCIDLVNYMHSSGFSKLMEQDWGFASLYCKLSGFEFMWANIEKAEEYMEKAYNLSKTANDLSLKTLILMMYSMILHEKGKVKEAEDKMHEIEIILKDNFISPYINSAYIAWKIFILIEMNALEKADAAIKEHEINLDEEKTHANEISFIPYARLLIAQNKFEQAEKLLSELYLIADKGNRIERLIEINILYTVLFKTIGDKEKTKSSLINAFKISAKENIILFFLFDMHHLKDILPEVEKEIATKQIDIPLEYIKKLKEEFKNKETRKNIKKTHDLSKRELEILNLIAQNYTNQQISNKLFISLNTCKTHVKNILFKLNAENRGKASIKGKELGIV